MHVDVQASRHASEADNPPFKRRGLIAACVAHALHDGYTDGLYAFLPVWQSEFALSYAGVAVIRGLYYATMGALQMPSNRLLRGVPAGVALAAATLVSAVGFLIMAAPLGFAGLCVGLVVAGVGASVQHPRGSLLVTEAYGEAARQPLGIYNFAGDVGKAVTPAVVAVLLPVLLWRPVAGILAGLGVAVALLLLALTPRSVVSAAAPEKRSAPHSSRSGFAWLMAIGALDTATRTGYLLFLPFLIHARGEGSATIGLGLALVFIGGAFGKATCGWLGERFGVVGTVIVTESATALLIVATLFVPVAPMLAILPFLGIALNGTSSVLYGTVPELAPAGDTGRAFALFYTAVIGAGGLAPILYGAIADQSSQTTGVFAAAITAALILPMTLRLSPALKRA